MNIERLLRVIREWRGYNNHYPAKNIKKGTEEVVEALQDILELYVRETERDRADEELRRALDEDSNPYFR